MDALLQLSLLFLKAIFYDSKFDVVLSFRSLQQTSRLIFGLGAGVDELLLCRIFEGGQCCGLASEDIVYVLFLEKGLHAFLVEKILAIVVGFVVLHSHLC